MVIQPATDFPIPRRSDALAWMNPLLISSRIRMAPPAHSVDNSLGRAEDRSPKGENPIVESERG